MEASFSFSFSKAPVTGQRLSGGIVHSGDGVAHLGIGYGLDGGGDVANFTGAQGIGGDQTVGAHGTHFHYLINRTGGHHLDVLARANSTLLDTGIDDNASVGVILAIEDQRLQRGCPVAGGRGYVPDDHFQHIMDVDTVLGGDLRGILGGNADNILHLSLNFGGAGGGQINLVDDRQDFQTGIDGQVGVGQSLGLHALGGVYYQDRAFAGGQGAADLVVKVHMAGGVDQIQRISLAVIGSVVQGSSGCLNSDAAFLLQLHGVQHLLGANTLINGVALFQQTVRQGGLAVIDMGDDRKITDFGKVSHKNTPRGIDILFHNKV